MLKRCFSSLKIKAGFLSAQHTPSLSAPPSPSPFPSLSACFFLPESAGEGGGRLASAGDGCDAAHRRAHSNLARSRGWGREAFWICQLLGTARFLSSSRSCTSPWWLSCTRGSCAGLDKQRWEATGLFLPLCRITNYASGGNPVSPPRHPLSFVSCVSHVLCRF